jgi:2-iminobutanoate/2-iminopropanoate deaminase
LLVLPFLIAWGPVAAAAAACDPPAAAGPAAAPYSVFRVLDELVFVSGQIGVDPSAPGPAPDFEAQMHEALARIERALGEAGSAPERVLRATVYLADPANMAAMNRIYGAFFAARGAAMPARSLVPGLDFGNAIAVEIDAIASRESCG